jgi:hypothetical protein
VPGKLKAGDATRVHLTFKVNAAHKAHWNNEAGESVLWIETPEGWSADKKLWTLPTGKGETSEEDRKIEFELRARKESKPGALKIKAFALYYVCEGADGTCLYLRQDLEIALTVG